MARRRIKPTNKVELSRQVSRNETSSEHLQSELRGYFGYCFSKAAQRHRSLLDQHLGQYKIVSFQLGILRVLQKFGPLSQIDLGLTMGIDKASMVKFVDALEALGYLVRTAHPSDRRIKMLKIKNSGRAILPELIQAAKSAQKEFLSTLSASEKEMVLKIIPKLVGKGRCGE